MLGREIISGVREGRMRTFIKPQGESLDPHLRYLVRSAAVLHTFPSSPGSIVGGRQLAGRLALRSGGRLGEARTEPAPGQFRRVCPRYVSGNRKIALSSGARCDQK
jgi:hypothetical protein